MTDKEQFIREKYKVDEAKVSIVFFGQPGAGKSSLINALCGEHVAKTGNITDTTVETQVIEHGDVMFIDLPGYGTSKFPKNYFHTVFNPMQHDLFLCVFAGKLHEADIDFFHDARKAGKPCIFVRNKSDLIYTEGVSSIESRIEIKNDLERQIGFHDVDLVFVSSREDRPEGIEQLNNLIESKMDVARREKYRMAVKSYTKEELDKKVQACKIYVERSAKVAAANGFNPIMGADIAVDVAVLYKMYTSIRNAFNINEKKIEGSLLSTEAKNYLLKTTTQQGLTLVAKQAIAKIATKSVLKAIPFLGHAAAAYIGYKMIAKAGMRYVVLCYNIAKEDLYKELKIDK